MTTTTTEDRTRPLSALEDRSGSLKPARGFKVHPSKNHLKLSGHKLIGVEKKRPKPLIPVGPSTSDVASIEWAYKKFAFVACDLKESGRGRKMFYQENQLAIRNIARETCKDLGIPFAAFVRFIRSEEAIKDLRPAFAAVSLEAEEVEEVEEARQKEAAAKQAAWVEKKKAEEAARDKAAAEEETAEEIGDRILRAAAAAYFELEAAGVENALEAAARNAGIAARDLAEFICEQEAAAKLEEKRAAAQGRREAMEAAESPQDPPPEPEPVEVPESPEVVREGQRRAFAKMAGVSPRRRRAEQFLAELRAK